MMKLMRSFGYALNGLRSCFSREANFRIHLGCALAVVIAASLLSITSVEWMVIMCCIGLVVSMEMINTAIEQLCNVVHKDYHPGIKAAKDMAAGAGLVSAIVSTICGAMIFIPKIILYIKTI